MTYGHTEQSLPSPTSAVRKFASQPAVRHYNRLILIVLAVNTWVGWLSWSAWHWWTGQGPALQAVANLVVVNLTLAVLIRQQYVINFLFKVATSVPVSWPLPIRRTLAKIYHFGGIHVGAAIAATAWFAVLTALLIAQSGTEIAGPLLPLVLVTLALLILLVGIIIMALPPLRMQYHDAFERVHRFGGWAALILFWLQTILLANSNRGGHVDGESVVAANLLHTPAVWALMLVTFSIALPWLRLRSVSVDIVSPSAHVAIARFDHGVNVFPGSSTTLSRNPLLEWHSFANAPTPGVDGFRLTISRAGDWTGAFIDDSPGTIWIKGIPTAGVANIEKLFTRVVYVTTGSGIGVCLPHLLANDVPSLLVWATRNPRITYGHSLVDEITNVQPEAVIWDTEANGKPDMIRLAYQAYLAFAAEAVICISNKRLTWQVVSAMESRGIPAYGAIWDS